MMLIGVMILLQSSPVSESSGPSVSVMPVSHASSPAPTSRLPPSVSVTAVKPPAQSAGRSSSVAAQLHIQRERQREERERQRERDIRDKERRVRDMEQRKEEMFLPPGLTKQQKEQFMQNMNAAAAMASAMANPAVLQQQLQAAQAQLLRMQSGLNPSSMAAASQIPAAHMLAAAPYLLNPYANPFGLQQMQQLMAAQMGSVATSGASTSGTSSSRADKQTNAALQQHQELLRQAAEMQRQYFLDMIPQQQTKWKSWSEISYV